MDVHQEVPIVVFWQELMRRTFAVFRSASVLTFVSMFMALLVLFFISLIKAFPLALLTTGLVFALGSVIVFTSAKNDSSERLAWFYALCREYLLRDHTKDVARSLFPPAGPPPGTQLLELSTGPGFYARRFSEKFPRLRATGVDFSKSLIRRATQPASAGRLLTVSFQGDETDLLPYASGSIDPIIISHLFLEAAGSERLVRETFRILKPSGLCFVAEPTSGFRTRLPLSLMWLLALLTTFPAGQYLEPQQADVLSREDFGTLIYTQPWADVDLQYDGWYQYAVCRRGTAPFSDIPPRYELLAEKVRQQVSSGPTRFSPPDPERPAIPAFS